MAASAAYAFSLLTGLVVARYAGPSGRGAYNGVQLAVGLFATIPTGLASALAYETLRRREAFAELLPAFKVLLGGVVVLAWCATALWSIHAGWSVELITVAAVVPAATLLAVQQNVYVALGWLRALNHQVVGLACATLLGVTLGLALRHGSATAALDAWVLTSTGAALVGVVRIRKLNAQRSATSLGDGIRRLLRRGSMSSLNGAVGALNYRVDAVLVAALLGKAAFGVYSVAFGVAEMLLLIARSLTIAVSREIGARDSIAAARLTAASTRAITLATTGAATILFFAMPPLLHGLLGPSFDGSATPLRILVFGIVALATNGNFGAFFILHRGWPAAGVAVNATMAWCQAALCAVLIPRLGLNGAAVASSCSYLSGALLNTVLLGRATGLSPLDIWLPRRSDLDLCVSITRSIRHAIVAPGRS